MTDFLRDGFAAVRIIESPWLTESKTVEVQRSRLERLFSWPWRPWKRLKSVTIQAPSTTALRLENGTLIMHPETAEAIRKVWREADGH
jgi:hypothetical protein